MTLSPFAPWRRSGSIAASISPAPAAKILSPENGQHVAAGEVLIELDRVEASAD